jgi:hypothetical protein
MATINDIAQRVWAASGGEGLPPDDFAYRVGQLVFPALEALARETARSPSMRRHALTDPSGATAALDADGVADLSGLIDDEGVLLDCLKYGEITHESSPYPLRLIEHSGQGRFAGSLDRLFLKAWLVGANLHTRSADGNETPLAGSLSFAVPRVPGLDELAEKVEGMLVDRLAARMGAGGKSGGAKAKDGD